MTTANSGNVPTDREIVITRTFNAPRELVWKAWTDPEHIAQWWGPEEWQTRVIEYDFTPGGRWRHVMDGPEDDTSPVTGAFREIVPIERLVTTIGFDVDFSLSEHAELPRGMVLTVLFEAAGEQTQVTLRIAHESERDRRWHEEMGVVEGWQSQLNCLDAHLATM